MKIVVGVVVNINLDFTVGVVSSWTLMLRALDRLPWERVDAYTGFLPPAFVV
jgi:hypothetical protein